MNKYMYLFFLNGFYVYLFFIYKRGDCDLLRVLKWVIGFGYVMCNGYFQNVVF